jgi:hypothetical protein
MKIGIALSITRPRSSSGFDPVSLAPALALLPTGPFYSDLGVTLATATGSAVRRWADSSGNGRHADAPNDSARATLGTSAGKAWLTFDGVDDSMAFSGVSCKPFSVFAACRPATVSGAEQALVSGSNAQKLKVVDTTRIRGGKDGAYNWAFSTTVLSAGTDYRIGLAYDTTGAASYYLNGVADGIADADVSDDSFSAVTFLGRGSGGGEFLNGRLYALLLFERKLNAGEIAALDAWLSGVIP